MNHLYLLRHGLAVPIGTPEIADDDRPLTPDGERRVRQVGRALRRLKLKLDRIISSPLPRALKSAEIVAEALDATKVLEVADELRADRDAGSIQAWLTTRSEARMMIVGHNPSLSDLLARLVTGPDSATFCELRKAGVAALRGEAGGPYRIDWVARPRLFRR